MTEYIECPPHPALGIAYEIVEELKNRGYSFEFEGDALMAAFTVLKRSASCGAVRFRCSTCGGDGRVKDKTGGGHHTCPTCKREGWIA